MTSALRRPAPVHHARAHRAEPPGEYVRPTGMLLISLRKAVSVTLLAAFLTALSAGCGAGPSATGAPAPAPDDAGGGSSAAGGRDIDARLVHLATGVGLAPEVRTVLDDERDLARFPGYFAASSPDTARAVADKAEQTDFTRNVLVGWVRSTGCSAATDATLSADGSRLVLGVDQPTPPPECLAAYQVAVVFEVPRDRMPGKPRFDGEAADPPGPGTTRAFTTLDLSDDGPAETEGTEVTDPARLDDFLADLPSDAAAAVRQQLTDRPAGDGERLFGYLGSSCRPTGAALLIAPGGMSAVPTGDEHIRCIRPQGYAAVFSVPSRLVPDGAAGNSG